MDRHLFDLTERLIEADTVSHRTNEPLAELLADELDRLAGSLWTPLRGLFRL